MYLVTIFSETWIKLAMHFVEIIRKVSIYWYKSKEAFTYTSFSQNLYVHFFEHLSTACHFVHYNTKRNHILENSKVIETVLQNYCDYDTFHNI